MAKAKKKKPVAAKRRRKNPSGGRVAGILGSFLSKDVMEDGLRGLGMYLIQTVAHATVSKKDYANLDEYQKAMLLRQGIVAGAGTVFENQVPQALKPFVSPVISGARSLLTFNALNRFVSGAVEMRIPEDGKEVWKGLINWYQAGSSVASNTGGKNVSLLENLMDFKFEDEKSRTEASLNGLDEEVSAIAGESDGVEMMMDEYGNIYEIPGGSDSVLPIQGIDEEVSAVA